MEEIFNDLEVLDSQDREQKLFSRYAQEPSNLGLRNEIVSHYMYLSEIISKKFVNRGVDYEDIYQVGCLALIKAVERFNLDKGVKFVSFATPTIVGEIKRFFRDKASTIRVPRRIYEVYQKVNSVREQLTQELKRVPQIIEIANALDMSEETVLEIIESNHVYNMQSFDQRAFEDDDLELHETIGSEDVSYDIIENRDFLLKSLDRFNDVEKEFIKFRYFHRKTQKEIAEYLHVSQMYVSRLEKKVLEKFRTILSK